MEPAATDVDPLNDPRAELGGKMARKRIERFVVVVVRVEDGRVDSVH
jgi:hypothetical protein